MPGRDKNYSKGKGRRILEKKNVSKKNGHNRGPPQQTYY
jgi:hypothetical protein